MGILWSRVLDLATYSQGARNTSTTLLPAGANLPAVNRATGANQCSFSTGTYRTARRGGAFVGTVADFPQPSIYVSLPPQRVYTKM